MKLWLITTCLVGALASQASAAGITFNVSFDDVTNGTGVGFDDATFGAARISTFMSVLGVVDAALGDSGTMDIRVNNSETDGGGFLASAGPFFSTGPAGFQNGSAFTHITTGVDPFASVLDIVTTFDFGYTWNSDLSSPTGSEFDLFSVALHELTHGLGFLSLLASDGNSAISSGNPGVFSGYDSFLERGDGTALLGAGGVFLGSPSDLTSGNVFFDGPNARAGNGGNPVQVYAPGSYAPGSSISHVQASSLMNFAIAPGVERRSYSSAELGILYDIGYSIPTAVPEPSSAALLGCGIALLGLRGRRRKRARKAATA